MVVVIGDPPTSKGRRSECPDDLLYELVRDLGLREDGRRVEVEEVRRGLAHCPGLLVKHEQKDHAEEAIQHTYSRHDHTIRPK